MARYGMLIDLARCVGCQACTSACNGEWHVPPGYERTRVHHTPLEGTFPNVAGSVYVAQCNHCDHPPCVEPCPSGATFQAPDGIVHVDRDVCIGCGYCVEACPYGARFLNPTTHRVDKCDFCAPRLQRGEAPVCVTTCTAGAKLFGDLEDRRGLLFALVYEKGARRQETAQVAVGPNVYYRGKARQLELVEAAFPPHPPRLLAAGQAWRNVLRPLLATAVGATFVGQAIAFFIQLRKGERQFED